MADAVPSLVVDLGVQNAIDNIRKLGDVGKFSFQSLERILPHCTVEQLKHIEDSTKGTRDISPVTDRLWKNFFKREFGAKTVDIEVEKMEKNEVEISWRQLYEAKIKDREDKLQRSSARLRERYKIEEAKKRSRQIQLCDKIPTSIDDRKRRFCGEPPSCSSSNRRKIMKKAKAEFLNSREVKNLAAMKKIKYR